MNARLKTAAASLVLAITGIACTQSAPQDPALVAKWKDMNLYSIKTKTLEGKDLDLGEYKGKVALVVNVASRCGMTPQYNGLEKLYGELKDQGFVILGMPCNDFGGQEPGTADEIRTFCSTKYNVTFPMFTKVQTKPGAGQSEIYEFLGTRTGKLPGWNFGKYLVGRDGQPIAFFDSRTGPDDKALREAIEKALATKG
jgi:glutathione peroxidase